MLILRLLEMLSSIILYTSGFLCAGQMVRRLSWPYSHSEGMVVAVIPWDVPMWG